MRIAAVFKDRQRPNTLGHEADPRSALLSLLVIRLHAGGLCPSVTICICKLL
jgi:hypothetical protein